jgi:hypothetical protein
VDSALLFFLTIIQSTRICVITSFRFQKGLVERLERYDYCFSCQRFIFFMDESKSLAPTRARNKVSNVSNNTKWTQDDNEYLTQLVGEHPNPDWSDLACHFPGKTAQQISERWEKVLNPVLVKGSWSREEDEAVVRFVHENGTKEWTKLAAMLPGRIGKQCRERWRNHLDPDVNRDPWTDEEDQILMEMHEKIGSKWVKIAEFLPHRSDNAIKNRWNSTLKKKIEYERNGGQRPKRGRPSQSDLLRRAATAAKPHSADEVPKPPKFDDIAGELRGLDSPFHVQFSATVATPRLLSPFSGLRSPLSMLSPAIMRDMAGGWSPVRDFGSSDYSFSPSNNSLKESREAFMGMLSPMLNK